MRRVTTLIATLFIMLASPLCQATADGETYTGHGIAMHGDLKYPAGFSHFDYVNPKAPKGGSVRLAAIGSFDSLNPFILKGQSASGLGRTFDTLMVSSKDEAFSEYGLLAERVETPPDRSWVIFTLRQQARFHDGSPVRPEDVVFTFNMMKSKGHPFYRAYYANVTNAEVLDGNRVKFSFAPGDNRELALIIGQIQILSEKYFAKHKFDETTLEPVLGSGPYKVKAVEAGRSITYVRDPDYWAADLPVNVGRHNFDEIRVDYYRDPTIALEGFKAGEQDFRVENSSKNWATAYDVPAVKDGRIVKEQIANEQPTGMQGFLFNTRRPIFKDPKVRYALGLVFDFEWTNKNLFYGAYTRTKSYFSNSELASSGKIPYAEQLILKPYQYDVPTNVITDVYEPPTTDGSGNIRGQLRGALRVLKKAGWGLKDGVLTHKASGLKMEFEILLAQPAFERVVLPYIKNLEKLGVKARLRTVDSSQYEERLKTFDFDMIVATIGQSLSPGNEQRDFWHSSSADTKGGRNLAGIKDPVVDALVEQVIAAPDRESLINRTRVLDRVLLWGHYVIPHWHIQAYRVAYWNRFGRPAVSPKYDLGFDTWWLDPEKDKALAGHK